MKLNNNKQKKKMVCIYLLSSTHTPHVTVTHLINAHLYRSFDLSRWFEIYVQQQSHSYLRCIIELDAKERALAHIQINGSEETEMKMNERKNCQWMLCVFVCMLGCQIQINYIGNSIANEVRLYAQTDIKINNLEFSHYYVQLSAVQIDANHTHHTHRTPEWKAPKDNINCIYCVCVCVWAVCLSLHNDAVDVVCLTVIMRSLRAQSIHSSFAYTSTAIYRTKIQCRWKGIKAAAFLFCLLLYFSRRETGNSFIFTARREIIHTHTQSVCDSKRMAIVWFMLVVVKQNEWFWFSFSRFYSFGLFDINVRRKWSRSNCQIPEIFSSKTT